MPTTPAPRRLALAVAAAVAAAGVGWRLTDLHEWPFPFHPSVQYESALAARALWVAADPAARTPDRAAEFAATRFEHVVSPPVLPAAVAAWYAAPSAEQPWASKVFTTAAWVAACGFVGAAVVRQTVCRWAGVAAGGWLLFTPFGLMVCRSFCTEPVAVLGLAVAVWVLARPGRQLTWLETLAAGLACGLAAATKPGVLLPPVAAGFAGAVLSAGVVGSLTRKAVHTVAFAALLAAPSVLWVVVWLPHRGNELRPGLLADPAFYAAVAELVRRVVGWPALALGLAGAALAARRRLFLPAGLFAGYVGYVGLFTYHCATHDYYHTPLMVLAAAGLGWVTAAVRGASPATAVGLPVLVALLCAEPWKYPRALRPGASPDPERAAAYRVVREVVPPGERVVAVTEGYGLPLEAGAWRPVAFWPRRADIPVMVRAGVLPAGYTADGYLAARVEAGCRFAVVTDHAEYEAQPELRAALEGRGRLVAAAPGIQVFELGPRR
jgi:hypothetical protein